MILFMAYLLIETKTSNIQAREKNTTIKHILTS
ncbi:hypothetical protein SAMN06265376_101291 [Dokdonia pacifica]|uniref:Uncharacterized protein n=1 Tax=Dokdonia pacifica TaxID=1627892 RepID=A0A238VSF3_9FLAO|nr:hypothetical protein SAMN06265376_101291 [Dokdonia pacifica]